MKKVGKFIVLYGTNNLGKTTQAKLLVEKLNQNGFPAEYLKYPIYDLAPTGRKINQILRGGADQKISELNLQKLYAKNRRDFEPTLKEKLEGGINIVTEDYIGTGLAWGVTKGAPLTQLEKQNQNLLKENLAILLDGERFLDGKEQNHLHESSDELITKNRRIHLDLAKKYGWQIVSANQSVEKVQQDIWQKVRKFISI